MAASAKSKYGIAIIKCDCQSEFQDQQYGKGMRLANLCKAGDKKRCTVCNKEQ